MINDMDLLKQYATPFYLFDSDKLKKRIEFLRAHLPGGIRLCYAMKANTFIIKELEPLADKFEACSPGEAAICHSCCIPDQKLVISGVYKPREYLEFLLANHPDTGTFTVESMQQYDLLKELSETYGRNLNLLLRLTSGNQFGMDKEDIKVILSEEAPYLHIAGIQFFSGTQKQSLKKVERELEYLNSVLTELEDENRILPEELEIGPGFPVSYFQGENFDEEQYLSSFSALLNQLNKGKNKPRITLELGRSIAASCGTYFTTVTDTKCNRQENYAIVDGGIHQLVYYSQIMAMKTPYCRLLPEERSGPVDKWNICGSLCTINDILLKQFPAQDLKIGDVLAFENAGAYCPTEGIALFLSHALPGIVLKDGSGAYRMIRTPAETSEINTPIYET